jgi:hypothetical protein
MRDFAGKLGTVRDFGMGRDGTGLHGVGDVVLQHTHTAAHTRDAVTLKMGVLDDILEIFDDVE